jgi:hypothetical protein
LRISYRFFPHFRRTEHSLRFCGIFYKDNTTSETIFKYIVSNFSKSACQTSGHCFVQVDIRVQNGWVEKAELPAARTGAEPGVFVANMRFLWYAVSAASAVRALIA